MKSKFPGTIQKILGLVPEDGGPFAQLERSSPIGAGREAVTRLSPELLGLKGEAFVFAQGALYVYFDCFEEAHKIADQEGLPGNWLHAIVHRREPDASNSKYWYARVSIPEKWSRKIAGEVLDILGKNSVPELEPLAQKLSKSGLWEPALFVDLCEKARKGSPGPGFSILAQIQRVEWQVLLEYILSA